MRLAPEIGGRVLTLAVKEGDTVEVGDSDAHARCAPISELAITRARTEQASADAQLRLVRAAARVEDVRQAESQVEAARGDVPAAKAELDAASADLNRFELLLTANSGSQKQRDDAATRREIAAARLDGRRAPRAPRPPPPSPACAQGRGAKRSTRRRHAWPPRPPPIATLEDQLDDATLSSPVSGIVTEKLVEVGEVIAPRAPVVVVTDLDHAWADVYVPEPVVPRLRLGQPATRLHRRRRRWHSRHGHLHLAEGGVHAPQRADRRGALEAGLPHPHHRRQQPRACSSRACRWRRSWR